VYPNNLKGLNNSPKGDNTSAVDQPGLKDMTIKAIDILQKRSTENKGWLLMSEAASIDKVIREPCS
jgi:alkaline phosphatase